MKHTKYLLLLLLLLWQAFANAQIKVACIGNSITWGDKLGTNETEREEFSYPNQLLLLLQDYYKNKSFEVRNLGVSGTTLLRDSLDKSSTQWSYWETGVNGGKEELNAALASKPDIVIIKFGTNDAREEVWLPDAEDGKNNFYPTYIEFINLFKSLDNKPEIYICYPIPSFKNQTLGQINRIIKEVIPLVKKVALDADVHLIDLHSIFRNTIENDAHIFKYYDSDKIHPNAEGAKMIAQEVFSVLKMQSLILNKP